MHGAVLTKRPQDWEILQQKNGFARVHLEGKFKVHPAAVDVGVAWTRPLVRVMREDSNECVLPWTKLPAVVSEDFTGTFAGEIEIPEGGLYRIETCLETRSTGTVTWLYRGDDVLHLGVGDVFLIAGQSNSSGYSRDFCADAPDFNVHLFRNRGRWDLCTHPMNESTDAGSPANEEMGVSGVSPYLSFGKALAAKTHRPVGFVQCALGGSEIKRWLPETGDLYQNMLERIDKTHGSYAGVLWYQGCSDGDDTNAPLYYDRFFSMVTALRKYLGYEIPFYTFQLNRFVDCTFDKAWGTIREDQRLAARKLPNIHVLPTTNCPMSDGIHNSAAANLVLGEKMAAQAAHFLVGTPAFEAPDLESAVLTKEGQIRLTFTNMKLRFVWHTVNAAKNGFTLEDEQGEVPVLDLTPHLDDQGIITLSPERSVQGKALVSFAWQADPTRIPPVDEVTFLPPLSFYQVPVTEEKGEN